MKCVAYYYGKITDDFAEFVTISRVRPYVGGHSGCGHRRGSDGPSNGSRGCCGQRCVGGDGNVIGGRDGGAVGRRRGHFTRSHSCFYYVGAGATSTAAARCRQSSTTGTTTEGNTRRRPDEHNSILQLHYGRRQSTGGRPRDHGIAVTDGGRAVPSVYAHKRPHRPYTRAHGH